MCILSIYVHTNTLAKEMGIVTLRNQTWNLEKNVH